MIDPNGFEISRPKTINLKMPVSRFDFNRKQRSLLKWIVTAGSRDNRLLMTGPLPEQATESPRWLRFHSPAHVDFKTGIRIAPFLFPPWSCPSSSIPLTPEKCWTFRRRDPWTDGQTDEKKQTKGNQEGGTRREGVVHARQARKIPRAQDGNPMKCVS